MIRIIEIVRGTVVPDMHLFYLHDAVPAGMAIGKYQIGSAAVAEMHPVVGVIIFLEFLILFLRIIACSGQTDGIGKEIQLRERHANIFEQQNFVRGRISFINCGTWISACGR